MIVTSSRGRVEGLVEEHEAETNVLANRVGRPQSILIEVLARLRATSERGAFARRERDDRALVNLGCTKSARRKKRGGQIRNDIVVLMRLRPRLDTLFTSTSDRIDLPCRCDVVKGASNFSLFFGAITTV